MIEAFGVCCFIVGVLLLAMVLMTAWDFRLQRKREERKPITERIEEIRANAAFMIHELQKDRRWEGNNRPEGLAWVLPVLDYYKRLEELASEPSPNADEATKLADDAIEYVKKHRIKGINVGYEARTLAELLHRQKAS